MSHTIFNDRFILGDIIGRLLFRRLLRAVSYTHLDVYKRQIKHIDRISETEKSESPIKQIYQAHMFRLKIEQSNINLKPNMYWLWNIADI